MIATHNYKQTWSKAVSAYIALTDFARDKFIQAGFPAEKILVKPNYLQSRSRDRRGQGEVRPIRGTTDPGEGHRYTA